MTYYEILEVTENASEDTIKAAYRALAKKYHPDTFVGNKLFAESKMQEINQAYYVLSKTEERKRYDRLLSSQRIKENNIYSRQSYTGNSGQSNNSQYTNASSYQSTAHQYTSHYSPHNPAEHYSNYSRYSRKKSSSVSKYIPLIIVISLFIIVGTIGTISSTTKPDPDEHLTPLAEPHTGTLLYGSTYDNQSQITITAPTYKSCVVKLKTASGNTVISFYVRANSTVTVGVPCQKLYVYFAYGKTWYGKDHLFGSSTTYSKDENICDFIDYTWEYTLKEVSDGNFEETYVDKDEFQ